MQWRKMSRGRKGVVKGASAFDLLCLMRMDKPWGSLSLLWPSLWALWLANEGVPESRLLMVFIAGAVIMRSFGCVVNDLLDSDIDSRVERTKKRPLAANRVSKKTAYMMCGCLSVGAVSLLFFLNLQSTYLAVCGFVMACVYPTTKRWLRCPQLFLGITFAWGIPMAYAASGKVLGFECWFLYVITALWIVGYDAIYAMQDLEDDKQLAVFTLPKYMNGNIQVVVGVLYGSFVLGLGMLARVHGFKGVFFLAWIMVVYTLIWQLRILSPGRLDEDGRNLYLEAFKSNQWIGLIIWMALVLNFLLG